MKELALFSSVVVVFLLAIPLLSYAETGQECASNCSSQCDGLGSGPDWASCIENCLKGCYDKQTGTSEAPPPTKSKINTGKPLLVAQNANYIACYKNVDMKSVLFRWCPIGSPWTATNDSRTNCYVTSEACAKAEMPQSWCIKCEGEN